MSKIVLIRSDELGEDHYDFEEVNRLFKISHWKLIDLLQMQKKSEIEEALQRMLIGRQYSCVRFEAIDGKYRESVKSVVNW
jgi:ribulose bisphosphate carboxylase small subunit